MTDWPEGNEASMILSLMDRVGCGRDAPTPIAEGLLERSIVEEREVVKEEELRLMAGNLIAPPPVLIRVPLLTCLDADLPMQFVYRCFMIRSMKSNILISSADTKLGFSFLVRDRAD